MSRLQEKRRALKLENIHRRAKANRKKRESSTRKKKKEFKFADPECQALWDMMPAEYREAYMKGKDLSK